MISELGILENENREHSKPHWGGVFWRQYTTSCRRHVGLVQGEIMGQRRKPLGPIPYIEQGFACVHFLGRALFFAL